MIRYTLFVLAVVGSAATAIASIGTAERAGNPGTITVIAKNQAYPVIGAIEVDECLIEDCSEE